LDTDTPTAAKDANKNNAATTAILNLLGLPNSVQPGLIIKNLSLLFKTASRHLLTNFHHPDSSTTLFAGFDDTARSSFSTSAQ
jgi:hypothetical protein